MHTEHLFPVSSTFINGCNGTNGSFYFRRYAEEVKYNAYFFINIMLVLWCYFLGARRLKAHIKKPHRLVVSR